MNHVWVHVWPVVDVDGTGLTALGNKIRPLTDGAGIEEVLAQGRVADAGRRLVPGRRAVQRPARRRRRDLRRGAADRAAQAARRLRRQGAARPPARHGLPLRARAVLAGPGGSLVEHDLDDTGELVPVDRPRGLNKAGILVAVRHHADRRCTPRASPGSCSAATRPRRWARSPSRSARGSSPRSTWPSGCGCRWSGSRCPPAPGSRWTPAPRTWTGWPRRCSRIVEFTQDGGEINIVVAGINVGAQPYWNAEATMLMHTKGILVMTPDSAMVLTGKQSLDFSGGVSAEDNFGIGGYDRVMGPNGQAQYWAPDLAGALDVLMAHYDHTYVVPGEAGPRRAATTDPADRDVSAYPHDVAGSDFRTVGEIFSAETNPDRKKAFDIRTVMRAVADQDHAMLERWAGMADAETAVVQDAHLGGYPVCLLGHRVAAGAAARLPAHRRPGHLHRGHAVPAVVEEGGPGDQRGQRQPAAGGAGEPVGLRRLTGVDAQPAAGVRRRDRPRDRELPRPDRLLRDLALPRRRVRGVLQGAQPEHDRARARGLVRLGARRRPGRRGGVRRRGRQARRREPRRTRRSRRGSPRRKGSERSRLLIELAELRAAVRAEKISEVAAEFDGVHNIHRAVEVGSVDAVIAAARLRPEIIAVIERSLGSTE